MTTIQDDFFNVAPLLGQPTRARWSDAVVTLLSPLDTSAAETTAGVTPTNYEYPVGDVRRYGAVGDGITDDTTAIDAAFTVCGIAGVKCRVPTGTYLISATISWAITAGFLVECDPGAVFKADSSLPTDAKFFQPTASSSGLRFTWRGGHLDGRAMPVRSSGAPDLLYIAGPNFSMVQIEGVHFLCNDDRSGTAGDSCLFIAEAEDYRVEGCIFQGPVDAGVYISGDNTGTTGRRARVSGNLFLECSGVGVISKRDFEDHIIAQNFFVNCTNGAVVGGDVSVVGLVTASKCVISNNVLRNCQLGIEARVADGSVITSNRVEDFGYDVSGTGTDSTGIRISGSNQCLVSSNYIAIINGTPHAGATGIRFVNRTVDGTTYESEYNLVENNTIYGSPRGIREENSSDNNILGPNYILANTGTAITLVGAASMQGVPMTGTTPYYIGIPGAPSFQVSAVAGAAAWVAAAGSSGTTPSLTATGAATDLNLALLSKGAGVLLFGGAAGSETMRVDKGATSGNALHAVAAAAGSPAQLAARGADSAVDLLLAPKGTGKVRFGTHTGSSDVAISGYVEIKDSGGTARKLAVIT